MCIREVFWRNIDPTQVNGQFADHGTQYRTGIFYHDEQQREIAESSKETLEKSAQFDRPIVTEITLYQKFFSAEEYHQGYHKKNPTRYQLYRFHSGRESFLNKTWKKNGA